MSQTNTDKKPVDKAVLDQSIKDKEKAITNSQTIKK